MSKKDTRVRNWSHYNKALVNRGSLTFWLSEKMFIQSSSGSQQERGRPEKYSDELVLCALALRQLLHLTLRATEGFIRSLSSFTKMPCEVPHYSTLSKRGKKLKVTLGVRKLSHAKHVLIDSTGIKVFGEGEWKAWHHGKVKEQLWRKLHIAIDAEKQTILAAEVTESERWDGDYLPGLLDKIEGSIEQVTADGAYDKQNCYRAVYERGAKAVFPPRHDAIVQRNKYKKDPARLPRDEAVLMIGRGEDRKERRKAWKIKTNYHRRSLVETAVFRLKNIFGEKMRSRHIENQKTDLMIRCRLLNKMTELGL